MVKNREEYLGIIGKDEEFDGSYVRTTYTSKMLYQDEWLRRGDYESKNEGEKITGRINR